MKLPSDKLDPVFAEINLNENGSMVDVLATFSVDIDPNNAEGWKVCIAIDSSVSMLDSFGFGLKGALPEEVKSKYIRKGLINPVNQDGRTINYFTEEGVNKAIKEGYLSKSPNIVQEEVRKFGEYCSTNLSSDGKINLMYWSLDSEGKGILEIGEYTSLSVQNVIINGPDRERFGTKTSLLPVFRHFDVQSETAKRAMLIIITDGEINDIEEVKKYTINLARRIETGNRSFYKAILIGVGSEINENQMDELDNLDTGTSVDIWDHKIASQMKNIMEIFSELVDENQIVAQFAKIFDDKNNLVKSFNDGLPAKIKFSLPNGCTHFILDADNNIITQKITGF